MFLLAKVFRIPPFPFGGEREIYISRNSYENGHANKILENGSGEGGGGRGRRFMEDEKGEVGERDGPGGRGGEGPYYELYRHIHYPDFAFVHGSR